MTNVTQHQRPGVYSVYAASSALSGAGGGRAAGLAAVCEKGTAGKLYTVTSSQQAAELFGADSDMTAALRLLLRNGASRVHAVPVSGESGYPAAFALLEGVEEMAVVVCESTALATQQALRDSVREASENRRERLCVLPGGAGETVEALTSRAAGLNC